MAGIFTYNTATAAAASLPVFFIALKILLMKRAGVRAVRFGERDKKDFLLIPCMVFFYYLIFAETFGLPLFGSRVFYRYYVHWYGSAVCFIGALFIISAVAASGRSFRIGLDESVPARLITKGPYAINRNPVYSGFLLIFAGCFITFANWVFLIYLFAGFFMIHRQVLLEEKSMRKLFGAEYDEYCSRVGRYF